MSYKAKIAIGLMSGTSIDGVDAALIKSDGLSILELGPTTFIPYSSGHQALLNEVITNSAKIIKKDDREGIFSKLEKMIHQVHVQAVEKLLTRSLMRPEDIDVIGFHGQTIYHNPRENVSIQIGDGRALAEETEIDVVYKFREKDIEAGGEGAPLVPVFHKALVEKDGYDLPVAFVNVGGISNITYIGQNEVIMAFDTGPGNCLLDGWVQQHKKNRNMDLEGRYARRGKVQRDVLNRYLDDPFFGAHPPKSLDKNDFKLDLLRKMRLEDGAATLTALTVEGISQALNWLPMPPRAWIISGGGANNPTMIDMLRDKLSVPICTANSCGWANDFIEAYAFGFLAIRSIYNLPLTYPETTGVRYPMTGGELVSLLDETGEISLI